MSSSSTWAARAATAAAAVLLSACSPTHDWREARIEGSGAVAMFPCKPSADARNVMLDGQLVRMTLVACRAGDATWALAYADVTEPARVTPALVALRAASASNLGASAVAAGPMKVSGMTPNPQAERVHIEGKSPDGVDVTLETGFFVRGTRVFQATVMGAHPGAEATSTFFDGLKLPT